MPAEIRQFDHSLALSLALQTHNKHRNSTKPDFELRNIQSSESFSPSELNPISSSQKGRVGSVKGLRAGCGLKLAAIPLQQHAPAQLLEDKGRQLFLKETNEISKSSHSIASDCRTNLGLTLIDRNNPNAPAWYYTMAYGDNNVAWLFSLSSISSLS